MSSRFCRRAISKPERVAFHFLERTRTSRHNILIGDKFEFVQQLSVSVNVTQHREHNSREILVAIGKSESDHLGNCRVFPRRSFFPF
jgi:hypothetical protein